MNAISKVCPSPVFAWRMPVEDGHKRVCTIDRGRCSCWRNRLNGAVRPGAALTVIGGGDRLLRRPGALRYVLAHETRHVHRASLAVQRELALRRLQVRDGRPSVGVAVLVRRAA